MNKMKLAHDHAMKYMDSYLGDIETLVSVSWKYVDLMFEQEEKRKVKGVPDAIDQEWQPDWSVAPSWAVSYTHDEFGGIWWDIVPIQSGAIWFSDIGLYRSEKAPDFGYQGDWRNSLRKRPKVK